MIKKEAEINTEFIKLDALLKFCGLCGSGGEAKQIIENCMVSLNGEICISRGKKIFEGDIVTINNEATVIVKRKKTK